MYLPRFIRMKWRRCVPNLKYPPVSELSGLVNYRQYKAIERTGGGVTIDIKSNTRATFLNNTAWLPSDIF